MEDPGNRNADADLLPLHGIVRFAAAHEHAGNLFPHSHAARHSVFLACRANLFLSVVFNWSWRPPPRDMHPFGDLDVVAVGLQALDLFATDPRAGIPAWSWRASCANRRRDSHTRRVGNGCGGLGGGRRDRLADKGHIGWNSTGRGPEAWGETRHRRAR